MTRPQPGQWFTGADDEGRKRTILVEWVEEEWPYLWWGAQ